MTPTKKKEVLHLRTSDAQLTLILLRQYEHHRPKGDRDWIALGANRNTAKKERIDKRSACTLRFTTVSAGTVQLGADELRSPASRLSFSTLQETLRLERGCTSAATTRPPTLRPVPRFHNNIMTRYSDSSCIYLHHQPPDPTTPVPHATLPAIRGVQKLVHTYTYVQQLSLACIVPALAMRFTLHARLPRLYSYPSHNPPPRPPPVLSHSGLVL